MKRWQPLQDILTDKSNKHGTFALSPRRRTSCFCGSGFIRPFNFAFVPRLSDLSISNRTAILFSVFCFLFSLSGCVNPVPPQALKKQAAEKREPAPIPARIDGKIWHIQWKARDTTKANAKALPVLTADAETGEFTSDTDPPAIGLNTVQAQIFQDGKHVANVTAARIDANRSDETIYGSGGVTIYSLVNPSNTTITADTMQWETDGSRLIAEGGAKLTRPARGKQQAFSQSGNRIIYDMKQGNFNVQ